MPPNRALFRSGLERVKQWAPRAGEVRDIARNKDQAVNPRGRGEQPIDGRNGAARVVTPPDLGDRTVDGQNPILEATGYRGEL